MQKYFSLKYFFLNEVTETPIIKKNKHKNACTFFTGFQEQTYKHTFAKAPCGTFTPRRGLWDFFERTEGKYHCGSQVSEPELQPCPHSRVAKKSEVTS